MDASIGSMTVPPAREFKSAGSVQPIAAVTDAAVKPVAPTEIRVDSQRSVERDATTGSMVYRLVDVSTGFVTQQTPSEARLRLRAYIDGVFAANTPEPAVEVTA